MVARGPAAEAGPGGGGRATVGTPAASAVAADRATRVVRLIVPLSIIWVQVRVRPLSGAGSLDAGHGDALHEVALQGDEHQQDRHDDDDRPGHQQAVVALV